MPRARRSLRDRDQDAITAAEAEEPDNAPPEAQPAEPAAHLEPQPPKSPPTKSRPAQPQVRTEAMTKTGLYFQEQVFQDAKSAYLVDLDSQADPATSFARWVGEVLDRHNRLTSERRAQVAKTLGEEQKDGSGFSRSFQIPASTVTDMETAIKQDRKIERYLSASQYAMEAIRAAIADARRRNGGNLPTPPARLPTGPRRMT